MPFETPARLIGRIDTGDEVEIHTAAETLKNLRTGEQFRLAPLGDVAPIIAAGGIFEYARQQGLLK